MISISYPVSGKDFVDRHEILRKLSLAYQRRQNVALVGPRRVGKTSIAKEFLRRINNKNVIKVTFDVQENIGTPARFALRLLRTFISSYLNLYSIDELTPLLETIEIIPHNLLEISYQIKSKTLETLAKTLIAYYPPSSKENERVILENILRFLDSFAQEKETKIVMVFDEFQAIRELEKSLGKAENILGLLEGIISTSIQSWYLFTGSMIRLMTVILEDANSPLYGRVERINVGGFTKEDMVSLVDRAIHKSISGEATQLLWSITGGNPYYTVVISNHADAKSLDKEFVSKADIEAGFIESITTGELNSHCYYIYDISIGRAKRANLLKEIMKLLSSGSATPTEIAKHLGKDRGVISPYLRDLINLSLIEKINNRYCISDYILKVWLAGVYGLSEPYIEKIEKNINQTHQESLEQLKTQRGYLLESYLREMLMKFNNMKFKDRVLPRFELVDSLNMYDEKGEVFGKPSNVEIDALCQGEENWLCEFKYKYELADRGDINLFLRKKRFVESRLSINIDSLIFVSISGFREDALSEQNVWFIDAKELNAILKRVNMRRLDELKELEEK